jgi:mono/diheme cytochrome c family protein
MAPRRLLHIVLWTVGGAAVVVALTAASLILRSELMLRHTYETPDVHLDVPSDPSSVARGAHLATAVGTCTLCHGDDLGGAVYADLGSMGRIVGPNLTRGRGGVGGALTVSDWVRAIRYGVRRDGTSLIVMPSEVYTHMTDVDLGALLAYVMQLPPVDRELPDTRFGIVGRLLLATGQLNLLVAPKTAHDARTDTRTQASEAAHGRYLADISGCHGCHGFGLSGGRVAGPPGLPPASNLTPTGLSSWTEADFVTVMREGRRPNGRQLDEFMPWRQFAAMTDDELHALWVYLRSVPARPTGQK